MYYEKSLVSSLRYAQFGLNKKAKRRESLLRIFMLLIIFESKSELPGCNINTSPRMNVKKGIYEITIEEKNEINCD
jgi:hypothetical protein